MMSHEQLLIDRVGQVRTRIRLLLAQQWLCIGLTAAVVASLLLVAATKLQWWTDAQDYIWTLVLLGGIAGALIGWTRRVTPMVAAQVADERSGLKERLSTAVELSSHEKRSEIAEAQLRDAAEHAKELRASQVLPWRVPKQIRYLAAAVAVLLAVIYVPELPVFHSAQTRVDREVQKEQGKEIQRLAKEMEKQAKERKGDKNGEILRQIAQNMKQLGKDSEKNRIDKKTTLLKMGELQKQMRDAQEKFSSGGKAEKSLDKVAADLQQAAAREQQRGNGDQARQLQQMADNISKRNFDGAKKQLEELARKMQSGQMTAEEAAKAAETLQQMAQSMDKSGLEQAGQQMKDAAKELQKAAEQAQQIQQKMAGAKTDAERQQLQQQMSQALNQGAQQAAQQCQKAGGT